MLILISKYLISSFLTFYLLFFHIFLIQTNNTTIILLISNLPRDIKGGSLCFSKGKITQYHKFKSKKIQILPWGNTSNQTLYQKQNLKIKSAEGKTKSLCKKKSN